MADNSSTSNSRPWYIALPKLAVIIALLWATDLGLGTVLAHFHARTTEGDFGGRINLALRHPSDLVILGSSRAKHHYIPEIIQGETGWSVMNAGFDAQTLVCHYGMEQLVLAAYRPKAVVLEIGAEDLKASNLSGARDKLSVLLPYYRTGNAALRELLLQRSPYEYAKLWSRTYPYNSQIMPIVKYTLSPSSEGGSLSGGYVPYYGSDLKRIVDLKKRQAETRQGQPALPFVEPAPELLAVLTSFVRSAEAAGVRPVIVHSPLWMEPGLEDKPQDHLIECLAQATASMKVPFLNVSLAAYPELKQPEFFKDTIHLNDTGAKIFSKVVGRELTKVLAMQ